MKTLDKKALLTRQAIKVVPVELDNGEGVYVRSMMAFEKDLFEQSLRKEVKNEKGETDFVLSLGNFRAKLAVNTICDEKGVLLFSPEDYMDLAKNMLASRLEKIVDEAQKLNAITEKDKEAIIKNSGAGETGNSSLDSAEN